MAHQDSANLVGYMQLLRNFADRNGFSPFDHNAAKEIMVNTLAYYSEDPFANPYSLLAQHAFAKAAREIFNLDHLNDGHLSQLYLDQITIEQQNAQQAKEDARESTALDAIMLASAMQVVAKEHGEYAAENQTQHAGMDSQPSTAQLVAAQKMSPRERDYAAVQMLAKTSTPGWNQARTNYVRDTNNRFIEHAKATPLVINGKTVDAKEIESKVTEQTAHIPKTHPVAIASKVFAVNEGELRTFLLERTLSDRLREIEANGDLERVLGMLVHAMKGVQLHQERAIARGTQLAVSQQSETGQIIVPQKEVSKYVGNFYKAQQAAQVTAQTQQTTVPNGPPGNWHKDPVLAAMVPRFGSAHNCAKELAEEEASTELSNKSSMLKMGASRG